MSDHFHLPAHTPEDVGEHSRQVGLKMHPGRDWTARPFGVNWCSSDARMNGSTPVWREGARIVSFFWGDPVRYIDRVHQAGGHVMHTVGSAAEARRRVDDGVDVIVAQGIESGGHVCGQVSAMALVPAVVDMAGPVPVVTAGGIADARESRQAWRTNPGKHSPEQSRPSRDGPARASADR